MTPRCQTADRARQGDGDVRARPRAGDRRGQTRVKPSEPRPAAAAIVGGDAAGYGVRGARRVRCAYEDVAGAVRGVAKENKTSESKRAVTCASSRSRTPEARRRCSAPSPSGVPARGAGSTGGQAANASPRKRARLARGRAHASLPKRGRVGRRIVRTGSVGFREVARPRLTAETSRRARGAGWPRPPAVGRAARTIRA